MSSTTIYSIYRLTNNINGKVYIGFTNNFDRRIRAHKSKKTCSKISNAIHKYGIDAFSCEVIYQSKDRDFCLNVMEPHFIREHNSIESGYNIASGGRGSEGVEPWNKGKSNCYSPDILKRMSLSATGRKASPETVDKIQKRMTENHHNKGKFGDKNPASRMYICIDPENNIILIHGANQFCKDNGLNSSHVSMCVSGKIYHIKRYRFFKYSKELHEELLTKVPPFNPPRKPKL